MSKNGETVAVFEREFASYVGARYGVALCNGTATLHTALVALGVKPGDRVAVPPLTMSATTIAVLHAGAVPVFCDVDPKTWLMADRGTATEREVANANAWIPVSLFGLHQPWKGLLTIDDAAQTLRPHPGCGFTSYSFQASKILALGEGGMLVTNDEALATRAREFSSLGYRMRADQPRIDPAVIKSPTFERHHSVGWNYRMNDLTAAEGLKQLQRAPALLNERFQSAIHYAFAIAGCPWITPQHVPENSLHDWWAFPIACGTPQRAVALQAKMAELGAEIPYGCWALTFSEPAFKHLDPGPDACPVARDLQPRILAFQTNNLASAERNATALRRVIQEMD